jgi:subtilase family protein
MRRKCVKLVPVSFLFVIASTIAAASRAAASHAAAPAAPAAPVTPMLQLRFAAGIFRTEGPPLEPPGWYAAAPEKTSAAGRRYLVAIARAPLDRAQIDQMQAAGAAVLGYVPENGYRVRVSPDHVDALRALPFIAWVGEPPAHLKAQPELSAQASRTGAAARTDQPVRLRVILEAGEPPARAHRVLSGLAVTAAPSGKDGAWRLEATVPDARLASILSRLVDLPEVEGVEVAHPFRLLNQDAVWVHQSFVGPSPQETPIFDRGIYGCGQTIGIADSGQDYDLCFFRDTVNGPPPFASCLTAPCPAAAPAPNRRKDILYYNWSGTPTGDDDTCPATLGGSGHGTHTSGSAVGDQPPYADCAGFTTPGRSGGDGLAPGAKIVVEEMGDGLEYLNNRGGTLWNLADVAFQSGARIHTDSWGGACTDTLGQCVPGCTIPYDSFARDADLAMWSHPDLLLVTSAGNAGDVCPPPVSIGTPANAKDLITAGAVGHGVAAGTPSSFSSRGPVHDGRLKPTLAAQGESTVSAASDANPASNNCDTCSLDGTSMSSPTIAGLAALVREYYTAGFYATGARNPGSGLTPTGALLKATLIDGAVALGASAPAPDFGSGYGRVLLATTLAFNESPFRLRVDDNRAGLATGGVATRAYDVAGGEPLRATLVWTDYPAALNSATARVNELRLEVIDPAGTLWFQTLDGTTRAPAQTSNAAAAHDSVNVEERLVFPTPAPGRWIVRVRGVSVPMGPQPFALVVRGAVTDCPAPSSPGAPTLATLAEHQVQVSWTAVPGAAAYNVYRGLGACPGGSWVPVATALTGTSFPDSGVSGGTTYRYMVTAASDVGAFCESPPSGCAQVVPTGDCFLDPTFAGAAAAASAGTTTCGITLNWTAAASACSPDVRYNVYRDTSASFAPGPTNRIARCVGATSYTDTRALVQGTTYHYVVRAEDATTGHGGPCRGGNEDANAADVAASPGGPAIIATFTDDGGDSGPAFFSPAPPWVAAATGGNIGPKVYRGDSNDTVCSDLTSPTLTLASPATGPVLSFATRHTLEYDPFAFFGAEGSVGQVEIATGPGFSNWTRVPLTPDYPAVVEFPLNNCDTTGNIDTYFSGTSAGYSSYSASLANWAGGDVRIRFRLSGDLLYPGGSWWIDEVRVTQTLVPDSCTSEAPGPPPIPDGGSVPGLPLRVTTSGANLVLSWDATQCPPAAVNVYYGQVGSFTTFTGGFCALAPSGSATLALPDNTWFVVAGTDGAATDGSWSRDGAGNEKSYTGASAACPAISKHVTNNDCP